MKHRLANAKELPLSTSGEFENLGGTTIPGGRRKATHSERSGLVLSDNPRWIAGNEQAQAKHEVATAIRSKFPDGVHMYHRRIINGRIETTVDILAVTFTGVWMIEVEEVRGSKVEFEGRHGLMRSSYDRFLVEGEDFTAVLKDIDHKGAALAKCLADMDREDLPVHQVLCLLGGRLSSGGATKVQQCHLATLPQLIKLMKAGTTKLSSGDVSQIGLGIGEHFRRPRRDL